MSVPSGKQKQPAEVSKVSKRSTLDLLNALSDEELEEIVGGYQFPLTYLTKPTGINRNIDTGVDLSGSRDTIY